MKKHPKERRTDEYGQTHGTLQDGTPVRQIAYSAEKDESPEEVLQAVIDLDTILTNKLRSGELVEVKRKGQEGIHVIPVSELQTYLNDDFETV